MDESYYKAVQELYAYTDEFLPKFTGNPCKECNICCGRISTLGVSELEFDYIEESLKKNSQNSDKICKVNVFKEFVSGLKSNRKIQVCPFFSQEIEGCEIHPFRPLSCRTFGCFIGETMLHLIPDQCLLKKDVCIYNDATFIELMPFIHPFYTLIEKYRIQS